ncbi:alpha/beta hydrolase [Pueribacillus theae]|uniref:Alpha/beta hydrolase n=1 Tax=Pueribacillus theae TaxID=2171751 RepID=A0A2U1JS58_9BACI|nr:alpha/beta hydrolase [Pueribacillus theae]PWA08046.1 alpha/beta hydrolase [Pueribacillus theae]
MTTAITEHTSNITLLNVQLYYEWYEPNVHRSNQVFLLIHGFLSSTYSFRYLIPLLAKTHTVISIDLPGFGKSEKSTSFRYSYKNYSQLIIDFITAFSLKHVVLIGHSMGGQIALRTAKIAPALIERCVLIGGSAYLKRAKKAVIYSSYLPFVSFFIKKWFKKNDVKENLLTVVYNKSIVNENLIKEYGEPLQHKRFLDCMIRLLRHREGDLLSEEMQSIATPCLLVWGKHDKVIPLTTAHNLLTDLPNAKLVVYEDAGHLVSEEQPEKLAKDILEFLNE